MYSAAQFNLSPYTSFMHETKVDLGNGIQLHVEVGGKCCTGLTFSVSH